LRDRTENAAAATGNKEQLLVVGYWLLARDKPWLLSQDKDHLRSALSFPAFSDQRFLFKRFFRPRSGTGQAKPDWPPKVTGLAEGETGFEFEVVFVA